MKQFYINKFESPGRLAELQPEKTLIGAGFKNPMSLCDIGAGTGVFTFTAAKISSGSIYALDVSDEMIDILNERKTEYNANNVIIKKVRGPSLPVDEVSCDMAIMCTVLHHIDDKHAMLSEVKRLLVKNGKLIIIDFLNKPTPKGPPPEMRLPKEEIELCCRKAGFELMHKYIMGENLMCFIFGSV